MVWFRGVHTGIVDNWEGLNRKTAFAKCVIKVLVWTKPAGTVMLVEFSAASLVLSVAVAVAQSFVLAAIPNTSWDMF